MIAKKITSSLSLLFLVMLLGCSGDDTDINVLVNDIFINPNKSTIAVGETQQLSPAIAPADATDQTVTWSSDNTSVATVSNTGLVTGVAIGTASISVSAKDGSNKIAQAAITVTSKILITSLTISPSQSAIDVGKTQQLSTGIAPADATNQAVAWSSSNTDIATVSASGLVTGVAAGTTTITVYTKDGSKKTAQASVTVTSNKILINSLTVSPSQAGITLNETQQLSVTITPADATVQALTWASSNTNVATVSASGLVTGVAAGTATITVSSQDRSNKTAQVTITVTATPNILLASDILTTFEFQNHTYYIIKQAKSWSDAAAYAVQQGGYLVEINNEAEQTEIETRLKALNGKSFTALGTVPDGGDAKYLWIGATDKATEGTWVWDGDNKGTTIDIGWGTEFNFTTAPGAYINWGGLNRGEPDDYQSNQDAAALAISAPVNGYSWPKGAQYEWNDIAISNSIWFIMEINN